MTIVTSPSIHWVHPAGVGTFYRTYYGQTYYGQTHARMGRWHLYVLGEEHTQDKTLFVCRYADTIAKFALGECSWDEAKVKATDLFSAMLRSIKKSLLRLPSSSGLRVSDSFGQGNGYTMWIRAIGPLYVIEATFSSAAIEGLDHIYTTIKFSKFNRSLDEGCKNAVKAIRRFERDGKGSQITTLM